MNDNQQAPITSPRRHFYEQLLRRLLGRPAAPALLLLHHYSWFLATGDGLDAGLFYNNPESSFHWLAQASSMLLARAACSGASRPVNSPCLRACLGWKSV